MENLSAFFVTVLFWVVCISGSFTLAKGLFWINDLIEHPRKRRR